MVYGVSVWRMTQLILVCPYGSGVTAISFYDDSRRRLQVDNRIEQGLRIIDPQFTGNLLRIIQGVDFKILR